MGEISHVTERVQVLPWLVSKISTLYADRRLRFMGLIWRHSGCRIHRTRMLFPDQPSIHTNNTGLQHKYFGFMLHIFTDLPATWHTSSPPSNFNMQFIATISSLVYNVMLLVANPPDPSYWVSGVRIGQMSYSRAYTGTIVYIFLELAFKCSCWDSNPGHLFAP